MTRAQAAREADCTFYPHMCQDGHPQIGHRSDGELCPTCLVIAQRNRLAAALRAVRPTIESLDEMGDCDRCGVVVGWAVSEELLAQIDAALREVEP